MTQEPIEAAGADAAPAALPSPREQSRTLLKQLIDAYPAAFFPFSERRIRPLKIGIHKDLRPVIKVWGYDQAALKIALSAYTRSLRYQYALLKEPHRVDLQGESAGDITDENRQIAQEQIKVLQERREQRRQQQEGAAGSAATDGAADGTAAPATAEGAPAEQPARPPRRPRPNRPPRERAEQGARNRRGNNGNSSFKMPPRDRQPPAEPAPAETPKPASRERGVSLEALEALRRKFSGPSS